MTGSRWVAAALAAGLALSGLHAAASADASAATNAPAPILVAKTAVAAGPTDPRLAPFYRQRVHWHGCGLGPDDADGQALDEAGAQCAEVTVPLDYTRPARRSLTLAISRLVATDRAERIGSLVINTGGPALPGLTHPVLAREAMGPTGGRFDLIGLDRRFVGRSAPLDCGLATSWLPRSAGADRESFDRMAVLASDTARRCTARYGDALPHASTMDSARDLDVIRAALGEPKLSYLGYSQGSYLGALYTELFGDRAGRIVLDSAIDPARPGTPGLRGTGRLREAALREWAAWAARRDSEYHLGSTAPRVIATVDRIYRSAARRPLRVGRYAVDDTVLPALLIDPLSDDGEESSAELSARLQVLAAAAGGEAARPTEELDAALAHLLTAANSPQQSAHAAILCADAAVPRDPERYWHEIEAHRPSEPLFGPVGHGITPCAFWPASTDRRPVRVHNLVPALVVQATGDINADYGQGVAMHRALAGSRLVSLVAVRAHGVYLFRGDACVDSAVEAYLRTGELPAADLRCSGRAPVTR